MYSDIFCKVYNEFGWNYYPEAFGEQLLQWLKLQNLQPRSSLDLACGTGSVAAILAQQGLRVTGVDMSEDMLTVACAKTADMPNAPRFVCQKLQELQLPRGVDLAVCALDSIDYILDPEDCKKAIERVYKALNPGGIFIFDVNTPEKLRAIFYSSSKSSFPTPQRGQVQSSGTSSQAVPGAIPLSS